MEYVIRPAELKDIPFLVKTIIEAEKAGTDVLSYSAIFGLSENEVDDYLRQMLLEEIDGFELSVSSFLVVDFDGSAVAALSAWIEGSEGLPSSILKGNLLNYILPSDCIEKAVKINSLISEIHIDYLKDTIQIGAGYVAPDHRGNKLLGLLNDAIISKLHTSDPDVFEVFVQVFSCNIPSLKTFEKAEFSVVSFKESANDEIIKYLPSNKKFLLKKRLAL